MRNRPEHPFHSALRHALKPRLPKPNLSAYTLSTSPLAISGWSGTVLEVDNGRMVQARRDPFFTPLFASLLGAGGLGLTGTTLTTAVGVASAVATTAATSGLQVR